MAVSVYPERMDQIDPEDVEASLRTLETYIHYICERTEFALTNTFRTTSGLGASAQAVALALQETVDNLSAVSSQLADAKADITRLQDDVGGLADNLSSLEPLLTGQSDGPAEQVVFTAPGEDLPLKACVAEITPVQEGERDPSPENVRPISGWTGAQIHISPTTTAGDGKTYTVDWTTEAGTVYGGTLDVLRGTLTVTWASVLIGDKSWSYSSNDAVFYSTGFADKAPGITNLMAEAYKTINVGTVSQMTEASVKGHGTSKTVYVKDTRYSTAASFRAAMGDSRMAYALASPVTYQLTPQMVTTLAGANNIWADTGDVTVEHGAYLAALQAEIERLQEGGN